MQQAITWANVDPDLCRHMASLGHNELSTEMILYMCQKNWIGKQLHVLNPDIFIQQILFNG